MTRNQTVLISGGGVAGPALAFWLRRYGFVPTVVERAPRLRMGGQRIELSGVGSEALHRMGLLERARAVGGSPPWATLFVGRDNRPVRMPLDGVQDEPGRGRVTFTIQRGALGRVLDEAVRDDVPYVYDDSIRQMSQDNEDGAGVRVTFESGAERHFDLVVGADGLYSNVRSLAFGPQERFFEYLGTHMAIFTMPNHLGWRDTMTFRLWPFRGAAITTFPGNTELEGLLLLRSREELGTREMSPTQQRSFVQRVFGRNGWRAPELLRGMWHSEDFTFTPSTQVRMDTWHTGRVALLGDAAYCPDPMSGQGACLALAGAHVLAGELARAGGNHEAGFRAYAAAMRDYVARNQEIGMLSTATAAPRGGDVTVWLMERAMSTLYPLWELQHRLGLGNGLLSAPNALTLADYAPLVGAPTVSRG